MGKERLDHTIGPFRIISPVFPSNKTTPATNMVAGVVFPQNSDSVPFRFSFGYHNITIPGDRSSITTPVPKHVIIDRDKDDNEYYTRLFAKEQSYARCSASWDIDGNGFSDRRFRVHAPNTKNSSFPKKPNETKEKIYSDNAFSNNHIIVAGIWDHEMLSFV